MGLDMGGSQFLLILPLIFELIYFGFSLTGMPPLLIAIIAFPAIFVFPGAVLLVVLRKQICTNMLQWVAEGFFLSIILVVLLTGVLLAQGLPLTSSTYSIVAFSFVSILTVIGFVKNIEIELNKQDILLLAIAFTVNSILIFCLSSLPRLFTADETSYIFSARMGISDGIIPPMGVRPDSMVVTTLLNGRCFWTYLLASFLGSTGLPAFQAGLAGIGFLSMTALTSSLLIRNKWLRVVIFKAVIISPLLLSFSILTLNDLAISFYAVFSVLFFVKSFSKTGDHISLNVTNLSVSLLSIIVMTLVKPNLLVFMVMWIVLVGIMLKYKFYRLNRKYKITLVAVFLPVVTYELCVDLPYVISLWILRNVGASVLFGRFLFISPIEKLMGWFVAPWWNPTASTLFTHGFVDYLDYFYRILTPESSTLLISAIILALPVLIWLQENKHKEIGRTMFAFLVLLSLCLFYLDSVSSASLNDVVRYSLWMIPLWIPLALITLQDIIASPSLERLISVLIAALILLGINAWLSGKSGGVYTGHDFLSRIWTLDAIIFQFLLVAVALSLLFLKEVLPLAKDVISSKQFIIRAVNAKNVTFCLMIVLILSTEAYFTPQFMEKSQLYQDHGFATINYTLDNFADSGDLVFANNYIAMRPYVGDWMLQDGLLLPPPETKEEFHDLLQIAPNNTWFLISNDDDTTWYEYANNYIKNYMNSEAITPEKTKVSLLPRLNFTNPVLKMTFDDANESIVLDQSGFQNNGVNNGAKSTDGYYGQALQYDGQQYVSIRDNYVLNVQNSITVSFFAIIEKADPLEGYMILSKGYAPENGSYNIFIWDGMIYFSLGGVGSLSVGAEPYVKNWHTFVFTYNGEKMGIYVDGSLIGSKLASGLVRVTSYDLEIGRDSERKDYGFVGSIDELQISDNPLNGTWLTKSYFSHYALQVSTISLPSSEASLFRLVNEKAVSEESILVKDSRISVNENRSIIIEIQIDSPKYENATILIATDRFTKVFKTSLSPGLSNTKFEFDYVVNPSWYEAGGFYWLHLTQARVILIKDNIIEYNEFVTTLDLKLMNHILVALLVIVVVAYLFARSRQPDNHANNEGQNNVFN